MKRRSLLLGVAAALSAPAIVKADSLMKIVMPKREPLVAVLSEEDAWQLAVGNRAELADMIWMITPQQTPFLNLLGRHSHG